MSSPVLLTCVCVWTVMVRCQGPIGWPRVEPPVIKDGFWTEYESYETSLAASHKTPVNSTLKPPVNKPIEESDDWPAEEQFSSSPMIQEVILPSDNLVCLPVDNSTAQTSQPVKRNHQLVVSDVITQNLNNSTVQPSRLTATSGPITSWDQPVSSIIAELLSRTQSFVPASTSVTNELCRNHSNLFLEHLEKLDLWALKMLDSSAKLPSGLLNGNVNQFGDFDQCLTISADVGEKDRIQGKYCLASLHLKLSGRYQEIDSLINSHFPFLSEFTDPGHRIAKSREIRWAVCVPSSCSAQDVQQQMMTSLAPYNTSLVFLDVNVDPELCYTQMKKSIHIGTVMAVLFFLGILGLTVVATMIDHGYPTGTGKPQRLLKAFSLRRTVSELLRVSVLPDDVSCIHGIRAMNAAALVIFHKSVALMFNPYVNRTALVEGFALPWSVIGRTAIIYTDSFILISGLLTSYIFVKELDKKGRIATIQKLASRFLRITPNLVAVVLFCTYILVHLGSGPQWNLVVKHHSDICQRNMWRNFLYIHNFYGFEEMCLTHTHQLGIDMQLFLVSPLLVAVLWRYRRFGTGVIATLAIASTLLRFAVTYQHELSSVVFFGTSVSQMFRTANLSYTRATHRATIYLMGIAVGFALRRIGRTGIAFTKLQTVVGWVAALTLGLLAMCGPYFMALRSYRYNSIHAAMYSSLSPVMWGAFLSWGILADVSGCAGFLGRLLGWRGFQVFSRLAYAVYLTQFPVYFYNVGITKNAEYYTPRMLLSVGEVLCILLVSIVLTLLVDLPCQDIRKILWEDTKSTQREVNLPQPVQDTRNMIEASIKRSAIPLARRRQRG